MEICQYNNDYVALVTDWHHERAMSRGGGMGWMSVTGRPAGAGTHRREGKGTRSHEIHPRQEDVKPRHCGRLRPAARSTEGGTVQER